MQKKKLIVGVTLSGLLVLSGGAIALAQGNGAWQNAFAGQERPVALNTSSANVTTLANSTAPSQQATGSGSTQPSSTPQVPTPAPSNGTTSNGTPNNGNAPYGFGYGMMGGYGGYGAGANSNGNGYGYGMMGGYGSPNGNGGYGMMGGYGASGFGMMGEGYNASSLGVSLPKGQVENSDQALAIAKAYVQKLNSGLAVDELHEFSDSYEVELKDAATDAKAYEFVIGKAGGVVFPEMGPNVMWNTEYGHMNWGNQGNQAALTVSADQATKIAQDYVAKIGQGYTVSKPETAPGYYEFMVMKDGKDFAELDVNGYTGQAWYENWHGPILNTVEVQ